MEMIKGLNKEIKLPELSLIFLIGISGSGKSSFAKKHFKQTQIVSSDTCRGIVSDDENDQSSTPDAFTLLDYIVSMRLKNGLLTVVDATNIRSQDRKGLINIARKYHCLPVAIVLNIPKEVCQQRNELRSDRTFGKHVIRSQYSTMRQGLRGLKREGFRNITQLRSIAEVDGIEKISIQPMYNNRQEIEGPFDLIGDVHGCYDELLQLLEKLGYVISEYDAVHPDNRMVVFLGDLNDRGPNTPAVYKLAMNMVANGNALCVLGNHDFKLLKYLRGSKVKINHGLEQTIEQLKKEPDDFVVKLKGFLSGLISHYVLDHGNLIVAHAGLKESMHGRGSGAVRSFCMYGETTGEIDEFGLPVRHNWALEYQGRAKILYGHTPVPQATWLNNTLNIDTGCVFGGELTALCYPENILVNIPAKQVYCEPVKPIMCEIDKHNEKFIDLLHIKDVTGKRILQTRLRDNITIFEENSIAALELISRFAVNPKWLVYLPPTMSPSETSSLDGYLEHPQEGIEYYKKHGIEQIICEEKHMGSRAVVIVCKDQKTVKDKFADNNGILGICYTRTGRNFFKQHELEKQFFEKLHNALIQSNFWENFDTNWVCFDCEIMPWSFKAQSLLQSQYAAVGAAAKHGLNDVEKALTMANDRNIEGIEGIEGIEELLQNSKDSRASIEKYTIAYQQYCWDVNGIEGLKLAPFHILATEGQLHTDKTHIWHMQQIAEFCKFEPMLLATKYKVANLDNQESIQKVIDWWIDLTGNGGEGMVIKPMDYISYCKSRLVQPAIKSRGKEYLRIIYSPEYDSSKNLGKLKKRNLRRKQSLAIREFCLGIEALERFVNNEPFRKVHESVFAVLALESEKVDPRL